MSHQKEAPPEGGAREQNAADVAELGNVILAAMEKWGTERGQRHLKDTVPLIALSMALVRCLGQMPADRRQSLVEMFVNDLHRQLARLAVN